jgi:hypothetical protein
MAKMLNRADKPLSCGCCTKYMHCPSGRRWEEREWRREWDDEQRSPDREWEYYERVWAEARLIGISYDEELDIYITWKQAAA